MRKQQAAGALALALVGGGFGWWGGPVGAVDDPKRSVYDRDTNTSAPPSSAPAVRASAPRRASASNVPGERAVGVGRRPRGYLSQGLSEARGNADRARSSSPAPARRSLPKATAPATSQGVVPAFFPAPIGGTGELPHNGEPQTAASYPIALALNSPAPGEHPLLPAVRWAKQCQQNMRNIHDYSAKMAKRERIDGVLTDYEYLKVKVRHEPFSVYVAFIGPAKVKGQEAIYVKGRNDGKLLAHANGMRKIFGTVSLHPDSMLAMTGNRYPITEMGIRRLTERLIEVGEHDARFGECEVKAFANTKINGRDCVCLRVVHPVRRREFLFSMAKIYVDSEHNVPVRYEAYDWPREPGGEPLLTEEYTYLDLKLNNGFTDRDFEVTNPEYQFK